MTHPPDRSRIVSHLWDQVRAGGFRGAAKAARERLATCESGSSAATRVELHLIVASCSLRQGHHDDAQRELEAARRAASECVASARTRAAARVEVWRAELAYFQGRYSGAIEIVDREVPGLEVRRDWSYAAFALRIRIAILLARADYDGAVVLADRAIRMAEDSGDDYVIVQILNVLGAVHFDRATSKLNEPHARAHLSLLDPRDAVPMEADARAALGLFQRARAAAERGHYEFAAWYVAGNIERLQILLGHADRAIGPIRKRLAVLQARGATYDEIIARSNLAWALRTLGLHRDALHELDVALKLARDTGTFNVLLEFLEYDRSVVLDALGDTAAARASYRRYRQLVNAWSPDPGSASRDPHAPSPKRPLEPFFLKRADRFILDHLGAAFTVADLARHCGVSWRTLEHAFSTFRGLTAVAHIRNVRLDGARRALAEAGTTVEETALRYGFRSPTTFALEYRKRFGMAPSRTQRSRADGSRNGR